MLMLPIGGQAGTPMDSLHRLLRAAVSDTARARIHHQLGVAHLHANPDSAIRHLSASIGLSRAALALAPQGQPREPLLTLKGQSHQALGELYADRNEYHKALESCLEAIAIFRAVGLPEPLAATYSQLGIVFFHLSNLQQSIQHFQQALQIFEAEGMLARIPGSYTNMGIVYRRMGQLDRALENHIKALTAFKANNDSLGMASCFNNIGIVHRDLGNHREALEYYAQALALFTALGDQQGITRCYNNMGVVYDDMQDFARAKQFFAKALAEYRRMGDRRGMSAIYNNLGTMSRNLGRYQESLRYFGQSLAIDQEIGDQVGQSVVRINIASVYWAMADSLARSGGGYLLGHNRAALLTKALDQALSAYRTAQRVGSLPEQVKASSHLIDVYYALGQPDRALEFARRHIEANRQMIDQEKAKALVEMETRFQSALKQQEIEKQRILIENQHTEIESKRLEASRQRAVRNGLAVAFTLALLLALAILTAYRGKRQANRAIAHKNQVLEQANAEIQAQRDEIESQRDMLAQQNLSLGEFHKHITESLVYAQSIQEAILPTEELLNGISADHFLVVRPCDMVSGDFFWGAPLDGRTIFALADSTGHGVAGAFMSILGVNILSNLVSHQGLTDTRLIMEHLRDRVMEGLSSSSSPPHDNKNGMDIALCMVDRQARTLQYTGAKLDLWLVATTQEARDTLRSALGTPSIADTEGWLFEVKADNIPVGYSPQGRSFGSITIPIPRGGVSVYLATDGFAHQFGGIRGLKYGSRRVKLLLLNISAKPFDQQRLALVDAFDQWKGTAYQVDDWAVLGVRL